MTARRSAIWPAPRRWHSFRTARIQRYKELKGYKYERGPVLRARRTWSPKALEILGQNPNGFFLVTESDDLDSAAHEHDGKNVIKAGRASTRWSR